ncbi:hypothetical protein IJ750_02520 [bacterium]|nr:hypothetical protein [bacterium]
MSISMEFMLVIVVNVLSAGIFIGGLSMSIKFIEKQIKRLEDKQDKHNNLIERMVKVEESTRSAHKRLDSIEGKKR